jgi:hypothetical protein
MTDIDAIKENMDQGEFYGVIGTNIGKAFISVLIILGAFISMKYLLALNDPIIWFTLTVSTLSFMMWYTRFSKLQSFSESLITDRISSGENNFTLIKAQIISWTTAIGVDIAVLVIITLISGFGDPLSLAILKILSLSVIATAFFVFTKREAIWTKNGFGLGMFFEYAILGIGFGVSTYSIGGVIVIASAFIGWEMTLLGVGLEVAFTSIYTYMDLQYWVNDYKRGQITKAERDASKQEEMESREIALRLSGRY